MGRAFAHPWGFPNNPEFGVLRQPLSAGSLGFRQRMGAFRDNRNGKEEA
jgi:hypothetical protein